MNGIETNLVKKIMLKLGSMPGIRVFRNNTGTAYQGESFTANKPTTVLLQSGDVAIRNARIVHFGLCKGSSDVIGFRSIEITPDMIGKKIAVFMASEVKTKTGKATPEQVAFINMVNVNGGIGMLVRSEEEAVEFLNTKP